MLCACIKTQIWLLCPAGIMGWKVGRTHGLQSRQKKSHMRIHHLALEPGLEKTDAFVLALPYIEQVRQILNLSWKD